MGRKTWSAEGIARVFLLRANEFGRLRDRMSLPAARDAPGIQEEYDRLLAQWAVYDSLWDQWIRNPSVLDSRERLLVTMRGLQGEPRFGFAAYDEAAFTQWWTRTIEELVKAYQAPDNFREAS